MTNTFAEATIYILLAILAAWSIVWLCVGGYRALRLHDSERRVYWLTHAAWAVVNLGISAAGLLILLDSTIDNEFITLQRNILLVNVCLDIGYMIAAKWLQSKERQTLKYVGKAVFIQGAYLFVLDIVFASVLTLQLL